MSNSTVQNSKIAIIAAIVALVGLTDAIYLTANHYAEQKVQCTIVEGCEVVLNSQFAEIYGVPLALFGALAYFTVFSLATLAASGTPKTWGILSFVVTFMAMFSVWLVYLQAFVIHAFCQFCMLSALVTFTLFALVVVSRFTKSRLR